jgi:hypothetical protein
MAPTRNMLGDLEEIALLVAIALGDAAYGVAVQQRIEADAGRRIALGSVYAALDRLERRGYLDMPLFFRFGRSSQRLYFLAGPSVGLRLAAEATETVDGVAETRDFSDQFKRVDVGVSFGAGATLGRALIEGRWTEGLRDAESGQSFDTAVRHRVPAVLAGFRF